jgi:hypothetical protein
MKLKSILIAGMMMLPVVGYAGDCVPLNHVIREWELTLKAYGQSIDVGGLTITTTECDPCKCPINGMAACYEFMAEREKLKVEAYQLSVKLLELVKRYGICK